jgi:tripartite-type tricarboxylate transporter receptor subunit TctC
MREIRCRTIATDVLRLITFWTLVASVSSTAHAQTAVAGTSAQFPTRSIRLIVPFPPGGSDTVARLVARRMTVSLGQPIVIDNRPGAAGVIGTQLGSQASPDGYTLVFITASLTITPATSRLPYDLTRDFIGTAPVATGPLLLVVNPSVSAATVSELIALCKAKPDALNYASTGTGSITHLAAELFKSLTAANMTHVPYKGTGPAQNELLAGRVQAMFGVLAPAIPHVQAGKLRALAVTSAARSKLVPSLPTLSEAGVRGYEASTWYGIIAPVRTPGSIVRTIARHVEMAMADADISEKLAAMGFEPLGPMSPSEFGRYIASETAKWSKIIKDAAIDLQQ